MDNLLAYNKTTAPLPLAAGNPIVTLPASSSSDMRSFTPVNVTSELAGLSSADYSLLQAQVTAGLVDFQWTTYPTYLTPGLTVGTIASASSTQAATNHLPQTELTAGINAVVTSIPVTSTLGFSLVGQVQIDNELITYTSVTPTSFEGATRGAGGTTAASHLISVAVQQYNRIFVFANSAGSDSTGDGSQANPFRTYRAATNYVAAQQLLGWNAIWLVNLTGLGKEILPAEYTIPPFLQATAAQTPAVPVGVFLPSEGGVNYFATPTTLDTITDANIPCKVTDNPLLIGATTANVVDTTGFPAVATEAVADNPLSATATTINVAVSTAAFPTSGLLKIDTEIISYNGKGATTFTGCVRGVNGTTAAAHLLAAAIAQVNIIKIDAELITYAGITPTSFTNLNRGAFGTAAAAHNLNTRVLLSEEDGLVKYVTNLNLVNRQGKFIMGSANGQFACIANNTTGPNSLIEVPSTTNFTAPFTIGDPSAEINRNSGSARPFLLQFITAGQSNLTFAGLKFSLDVNAATNGVEETLSAIVNFNMCDFDCAYNCVRALFPTATGCIFRRQTRSAGTLGMAVNNSVFLTSSLRQAGAFKVNYSQCIFDGCTPVGQGGDFIVSATKGNPAPIGVQIASCRVKNGSSHGIQMVDGGKGFVLNTTVKKCAGSAVRITVPGLLNITNINGYGNTGVGLLADDGGHLLIDDTLTTVTGVTGDIKSGNMTARTYGDFRANAPVKNQFDVPGFTGATADTTTGARVWQV